MDDAARLAYFERLYRDSRNLTPPPEWGLSRLAPDYAPDPPRGIASEAWHRIAGAWDCLMGRGA